MNTNESDLLNRLQKALEQPSLYGKKPQDLSFDEIVDLLVEFMLDQENQKIELRFGNQVGEELEDENDARFDPIALLAEDPDNIDKLPMYVYWDIKEHETELLDRGKTSLYAYNTLVFGAAIMIARSEPMSDRLRRFLINHLVSPFPPKLTKKRGRPKSTNEEIDMKYDAIEF